MVCAEAGVHGLSQPRSLFKPRPLHCWSSRPSSESKRIVSGKELQKHVVVLGQLGIVCSQCWYTRENLGFHVSNHAVSQGSGLYSHPLKGWLASNLGQERYSSRR